MNGTDVTASLYVKANPDTNRKNNTIMYGIVHRANKLAMCLIKFINVCLKGEYTA